MCGIFGYIGNKQAQPLILKGLSRLEYRGYDSAGLAVVNGSAHISIRKKKGKVRELAKDLEQNGVKGVVGLGHTRWATHGAPNDVNAHPHADASGKIAVVHNGIIENYSELKSELMARGIRFKSETDTEVLAHLISIHYASTHDLKKSVDKTVKLLKGSYALGAIHSDEPDTLVVVRHESPIIIGLGKGENFVASDYSALLDHTHRTVVLNNGETARITASQVEIWDNKGKPKKPKVETIEWDLKQAEKGGFAHFMLKEIHEQPEVLERMIERRLKGSAIRFDELKIKDSSFKKIKRAVFVACGTSYHAGMVARYLWESELDIPVSVDMSSEFRYRGVKVDKQTLVIVISQSGETADTLAALREAKRQGALTLAVCNVLGSSIEREAHGVIRTDAGPEIAVASTKAYTAQLGVLYLLAFYLVSLFKGRPGAALKTLVKEFRKIPTLMRTALQGYQSDWKTWEDTAHLFNVRYHEQLDSYYRTDPEHRKRSPNGFFLYIGRHNHYPSALEGALKLKEIAYISAEGYAAGEMKHGPIALIDENPWVICIAVASQTYDKMVSNIQEIKARGGMVTAIVSDGDTEIKKLNLFRYIEVPQIDERLSPFLVAVPLQLIAYCVAKEFREEIDQPRNLAKSVTVE